ncbi:hypothetical protein C8J56DRAFT_342859 [Mycena floridula]|nr:hypothetical protein C8J56DRAFT_342859 [Mycena floridula]
MPHKIFFATGASFIVILHSYSRLSCGSSTVLDASPYSTVLPLFSPSSKVLLPGSIVLSSYSPVGSDRILDIMFLILLYPMSLPQTSQLKTRTNRRQRLCLRIDRGPDFRLRVTWVAVEGFTRFLL